MPVGGRLLGVGRDQIVGLEPLHLRLRQTEGGDRLTDQGELRHQIVRRRRAVCLVFLVNFRAEGLARSVENHAEPVSLRIVDQLEQHGGKAIDRVDRGAVRPGHRRQGVIGPEDIARPVYQDEMFLVRHQRNLSRRGGAAVNGRPRV